MRHMKLSKRSLRSFLQKMSIKSHKSCWPWNGRKDLNGYGKFTTWDGEKKFDWYAHRLSWTIENGSIPKGLVVNHICSNPWCVNPSHLEVCTQRQNVQHREKVKEIRRK